MVKQTLVTASCATLLALTSTAWVNAQQEPANNSEQPAANTAQQQPAAAQYRVKQLLGSKVRIEGEVAIGTVDDLVFDDNGVVEYLIVMNENKLVSVPWEAAKFNFEKRTATINIAPERFRRVPTFTVDTYPTFSTPTYRTQTYQYYGLTPGQARRLERRLP